MLVPGGHKHPSYKKNKGPSHSGIFIENGSNNFEYIPVTYGARIPEYNHIRGVSRKITVRILRVQTRNTRFLETSFTRQTDFGIQQPITFISKIT
jgi:hypothetical protein